MRARDVRQVGRPDHPHAESRQPRAGRRQVGDLEDRHVAAVAAAPLQIPAGRGARLYRGHHLDERVPGREHRVGQPEPPHTRVVKGLAPAERIPQLARHLTAVVRHQGYLAETGAGQHIPTISSLPRSGPDAGTVLWRSHTRDTAMRLGQGRPAWTVEAEYPESGTRA